MNIITFLIKGLFILPHYFTNWILLFFFINLYYDFPKSAFFTLLTLINLGFIGGFYITYIIPKAILVPELNITVSGVVLKTLDMIVHQLPFFYINHLLFRIKQNIKLEINFIFSIIMVFTYLLIHNPLEMYQIQIKDLFIIGSLTCLISLIMAKI